MSRLAFEKRLQGAQMLGVAAPDVACHQRFEQREDSPELGPRDQGHLGTVLDRLKCHPAYRLCLGGLVAPKRNAPVRLIVCDLNIGYHPLAWYFEDALIARAYSHGIRREAFAFEKVSFPLWMIREVAHEGKHLGQRTVDHSTHFDVDHLSGSFVS